MQNIYQASAFQYQLYHSVKFYLIVAIDIDGEFFRWFSDIKEAPE